MTAILDRKKAPSFTKPKYFEVPKVKKESSRIPFWTFRDDQIPLFKLELVFGLNKALEKLPGQGLLLSKLLAEGTSKYNSTEIQNKVAHFGGHLDVKSGLDRFVVTLYSQKKYGKELIQLLQELIFDSIIPEKEFQKVRAIELENLRVSKEKTSFVASTQFRKMLFTDHAYGRVLEEANLDERLQSDVYGYYKEFLLNSLSDIFLSGGFDQIVVDEVNTCFAADSRLNVQKILEPISGIRGKKELISKDSALQSSLRIGGQVVSRNDADYIDLIIANEILGGYFGSRLMKNIREEKGLTYGIYSQCATYEQAAFWTIAADVKKELVKTALEEIYKEIELLIAKGVSDEEMEIVTNYMAGSFLSSINTPFDVMDKFKLVHYGNVEYSYFKQFYDRLETIKTADIQKMAEKYFLNSNELVVG